MGSRALDPDEAALWARVMAGVRPLKGAMPAAVASPPPTRANAMTSRAMPPIAKSAAVPRVVPAPAKAARKHVHPPANTLDGSWDRDLARGSVSPDRTVDLHGHTLHSAYDLLDAALDSAIRSGARVILLVTGKPPRPASERPHARGAIRAATGDWLAGSRHAASIAAVRPAHPRHGGAGALYIVLKRARPREAFSRKS